MSFSKDAGHITDWCDPSCRGKSDPMKECSSSFALRSTAVPNRGCFSDGGHLIVSVEWFERLPELISGAASGRCEEREMDGGRKITEFTSSPNYDVVLISLTTPIS